MILDATVLMPSRTPKCRTPTPLGFLTRVLPRSTVVIPSVFRDSKGLDFLDFQNTDAPNIPMTLGTPLCSLGLNPGATSANLTVGGKSTIEPTAQNPLSSNSGCDRNLIATSVESDG